MSQTQASDSAAAISPQAAKLKALLDGMGAVPFFEKRLTSSDATGRIVLPKAVVEAQFADTLEQQGVRVYSEDIDGGAHELTLRHWTNDQSRLYLLDGCGEVLRRCKLGSGDVAVFARKRDGALLVAGRPAGPEDALKRAAPRTTPEDKTARAAKTRRKVGPQTDGIFRSAPAADVSKRVFSENGVWACVVDIEGEAFQALFDLEADAWEAFHAAVAS